MMRRPLVAGNWKMTTTQESGAALSRDLAEGVGNSTESVDVLVCPPYPYLTTVADAIKGSGIELGAQDAYYQSPGAFTGEVANEMLTDIGCSYVILGHSERRHVMGECDETTNKKITASLAGGLKAILCVGELLTEREAKQTEAVLDRQMSGGLAGISEDQMADVVIAYEPVWAIGTGKTATPEQAESAHAHLRNWLESNYNVGVAAATRILYGGSVKPDNAAELIGQANVDGALVGGASLKAELFLPIIQAAVATVA
jgi:triosephosphate isomerase